MRPPALLVLGLLVLTACTTAPLPEADEYLFLPPRVEAPEPVPGAQDLHLADLVTAGHLQGIAILRPDGRIDTLVYHRYAAPLEDMVGDYLRARLSETGRFRNVLDPRSIARTPLRLSLRIARMEVVERAEGLATGHVRLEATLTDEGRRVLYSGATIGEAATRDPDDGVPGLVEALERALDEAARTLAAEVAAAAPLAP